MTSRSQPADGAPAGDPVPSLRVEAARHRAAERVQHQRDLLRPLGWVILALVVTAAFGARPAPGLHGRSVGVTTAIVVFAVTLAVALRTPFAERPQAVQAVVTSAMGAAGVTLVALQTQGATELAAAVAVWLAVTRLAGVAGWVIAAAITVAVDIAATVAGASSTAVLAATALLALVALVAHFMKASRDGERRAEVLVAQLEDARDEQARAAAAAERARIAGELHDVLAHSLSGAAIQLEAARKLAERDRASQGVASAIGRAGQLVKDGLANARDSVAALRGDTVPGVEQLSSLIAAFREDLSADVQLAVEGIPRQVSADAGLAVYRGVQEALTNIARYAPGAPTTVVVRYAPTAIEVCVEDHARPAEAPPASAGLTGVGGGHGLAGLRDRLAQLGGAVDAGPTADGWRVDMVVPG